MHLLTIRERLYASGFCLFGILACVCMAYEAGIFETDHKVEFLGGPTTDTFLQRLRPEATMLYASIGWLAMGVGLWGTNPKYVYHRWYNEAIGLILAGVVLGLLMIHARSHNGHSLLNLQPGFYLGMLACSGMIATGYKANTARENEIDRL